MMADSLISIIVPIHNLADYLPKCIDSIINQTYKNLEILLIDDGSIDDSGRICDEYQRKDNRIKVTHKKNGGVSSARNKGLEIANGEFIGFIDGDDWAATNMYELLYRNIKKSESDLAFGTMCRMSKEQKKGCEIQLLEGKQILDAYINPAYFPHIEKTVCDKLFHRELIGKTRFMEGKRSEDAQFTMVIMSKTSKCVYVQEACYFYLDKRAGNFTTTLRYESYIIDKVPILLEQIEILKKDGREDLADRQESVFYSEMIRFYVLVSRETNKTEESKKTLEYLKSFLCNNKHKVRRLYKTCYVDWKYKCKIEFFMMMPQIYVNCMKSRVK